MISLFNLEPERIGREDTDGIHIKWELDCLAELKKSLELVGGKLLFNHGDVVAELSRIHEKYEIKNCSVTKKRVSSGLGIETRESQLGAKKIMYNSPSLQQTVLLED